jgi:hypothetical protein
VKYLIDYQGMADSFLKGSNVIRQSFLPAGFLGAIDDQPYTLDIEKAKGLLEEAGIGPINVKLYVRNDQERMEIAQSLQNTMAQGGINVELRVGTGAEILGEYRARNHEMTMEAWGPDYPDPHTNADTFARNPDNSDEAQATGVLAWRNAWPAEETNDLTNAAVLEQDADTRAGMYEEIQRIHQQVSPFAMMFQQIEQVALRSNVEGFSPAARSARRRTTRPQSRLRRTASSRGCPMSVMAEVEDSRKVEPSRTGSAARAASCRGRAHARRDAARLARHHLRDRPGHPDRPRARHHRRARHGRAVRRRPRGPRPRRPDLDAVRDLRAGRRDRRLRAVAPERPARDRGHRAGLSRHA